MAVRSLLSRLGRLLPLAAVGTLLLAALFLVAGVEQESSRLGRITLLVISLTGIALLVLLVAIGRRLWRLLRELRSGVPGARLRTRLVGVFIALALAPVLIVFLFSVEFLDNTIDGWFDTGAEPALADSIELAQLFLDLRTRQARDELARIARLLPPPEEEDARLDYLFGRASSSGPVELTLLGRSGRVEALIHIDPQQLVADLPSAFALGQAAGGEEYSAAETVADGLRVRVLMPIDPGPDGQAERVLQGIFPLPEDFAELAGNIERAYFRFDNAMFLRQRLQQSLVLILSLVLGVSALLAILLGFNAARRMVRPIRDLALATETLRSGERPAALDVDRRDELGFLVESFNNMTEELFRTRQELESQRSYLETLLSRLTAGVIAFDADHRLGASNRSAAEILGVPLEPLHGERLDGLIERLPELEPLLGAIRRRMSDPGSARREEIKLERPERTVALVCRGATMPDPERGRPGHVVVFDDVTMLDQAQRQAAWAELARRLAHEVKNPLTPIRLAAERLRMNLGDALDEDRRNLLERATRTIIHQVDALRAMVDAFGDYARPEQLRREALDLDALIGRVVELWSAGDSGVGFELDLDHGGRRPLGDPGQFQQILNNLVQNAREAHPQARPTLSLRTRIESEPDQDWLCLEIDDDGPGFDPALLDRVFEPYVSSKPRGTGLGLAIVQRIVDQMGGRIAAMNAPGGGGRIRIELPLPADPRRELGQPDRDAAIHYELQPNHVAEPGADGGHDPDRR